jgi:hypothetical protein
MFKQLGIKKITSIDFEENVIKKMINRGVSEIEYKVMDFLNNTFEEG